MINRFSGMWISVKEKFKTPSLFIRAAAHTYLGAAELGPRKVGITSEQFGYIDFVTEES